MTAKCVRIRQLKHLVRQTMISVYMDSAAECRETIEKVQSRRVGEFQEFPKLHLGKA
jgi:hypothetical protein